MRFETGKFGQPECVVDVVGGGSGERRRADRKGGGSGERRLSSGEVAAGGEGAASGERRLSDLVDEQNASRPTAPTNHPQVDRLIRTIWRLRQDDGCSWDREQTHASITKNMVEEAYEAVDAIEANDVAHLCEELGDVLEQVLLHSQIAADAGEFDIDDVARGLNEKLVRRHPHVFGDLARAAEGRSASGAGAIGSVDTAEGLGDSDAARPGAPGNAWPDGGSLDARPDAPDAARLVGAAPEASAVLDIWDDVKRLEREARGELADGRVAGLLDSVPSSLPALMQAQKISKRAAKAGFEWETTADVWAKVAEERAEFEAEEPGSAEAAVEFGDLLLALVNVARKEGIDAEEALAASNRKFRARWARMEAMAREAGRDVEALSTAEQNDLWDRAKAEEKSGR